MIGDVGNNIQSNDESNRYVRIWKLNIAMSINPLFMHLNSEIPNREGVSTNTGVACGCVAEEV